MNFSNQSLFQNKETTMAYFEGSTNTKNLPVLSDSQHHLLQKIAQNTIIEKEKQNTLTTRSMRPSIFLNDFHSTPYTTQLPQINTPQKQVQSLREIKQPEISKTERETIRLPSFRKFDYLRRIDSIEQPQFLSHQCSPQKDYQNIFSNTPKSIINKERKHAKKKTVQFHPEVEMIHDDGLKRQTSLGKTLSRFRRNLSNAQEYQIS